MQQEAQKSPRILTINQVAERLQVSYETVRHWLRTGTLKGFKIGGFIWRIKESDLEEFIDKEEYKNEASIQNE